MRAKEFAKQANGSAGRRVAAGYVIRRSVYLRPPLAARPPHNDHPLGASESRYHFVGRVSPEVVRVVRPLLLRRQRRCADDIPAGMPLDWRAVRLIRLLARLVRRLAPLVAHLIWLLVPLIARLGRLLAPLVARLIWLLAPLVAHLIWLLVPLIGHLIWL